MPSLVRRANPGDSEGGFQPIYIGGIVLAGAILLGVALWLGIRHLRRRRAQKGEDNRGAAFLSVRGIVKDTPDSDSGEKPNLRVQTHGFSRTQMHAGITMPDRTLPPPRSRQEILDFHRQSGTFPKPFSFSPHADHLAPPNRFSSAHSPADSDGGGARSSWVRYSFMSTASSALNRFSVMSSSGSSSFGGSEPTTGTTRRVKQLFTPVLPDELLLTKLSEQLTIVQSFDDGWCVVGRENTSGFLQKTSLFAEAPEKAETVELGCVPAWCFLKPVKGLRAERPVRSSSLGITVQMEKPGFGGEGRDQLVSWSNF